MSEVDRFKERYGAEEAYDLENPYFDQEHLEGKAWIAQNDVVALVHESVDELGVMDLGDCDTPPESVETAEITDTDDGLLDSGETVYELSGGGQAHMIAERYCEMVADVFECSVRDVVDNARLNTDNAHWPVRIVLPSEYDAVISPYVGNTG